MLKAVDSNVGFVVFIETVSGIEVMLCVLFAIDGRLTVKLPSPLVVVVAPDFKAPFFVALILCWGGRRMLI